MKLIQISGRGRTNRSGSALVQFSRFHQQPVDLDQPVFAVTIGKNRRFTGLGVFAFIHMQSEFGAANRSHRRGGFHLKVDVPISEKAQHI